MKLTLGFSTCPNDTFIFDAMVNHKIDTEGLEFDVHLADVEELNQSALKAVFDVTKLSFNAFAYCSSAYQILDHGSALGNNNGPILIAKKHFELNEVSALRIGIPGKYTTANLLFSIAFPDAHDKSEILFSDIETQIENGSIDAGLIIHETRFTYEQNGFVKIIDLGEYWENLTKSAIPLGAIVIKRSLPLELKLRFNRVLKKSIEYAFENPQSSAQYIKKHSQETADDVVMKHIGLYVNDYTKELGFAGKQAIRFLYSYATERNVIPALADKYFLID